MTPKSKKRKRARRVVRIKNRPMFEPEWFAASLRDMGSKAILASEALGQMVERTRMLRNGVPVQISYDPMIPRRPNP